MLLIGYKNLRRDPVRMWLVVFGVVFAVVLVVVEVGMLLGLVRNASILIDRSRADIWVTKVDVKTFDFASPVDRRVCHRLESVEGVERVEEFNLSYTMWRLPTGGTISVQVVGFDVHGELAPELDLREGELEALHNQDTIIIDRGECAKLGGVELGDTVEIIDHRAKVVGFTEGMKSFTTTPFVFASLRRSYNYDMITQGGRKAVYYLVKVAEGQDVETVRRRLQAEVPGVEVHTKRGFSTKTRLYWLFETGVGLGFLVAAFLGILVGTVIVSQTLYAMTIERLPEFGVLKAMGASMRELTRIVLEQSLACGLLGLLIGLAISYVLSGMATSVGTAVVISAPLLIVVVLLTVCLCAGASVFSIRRLRRLEPTSVFRA